MDRNNVLTSLAYAILIKGVAINQELLAFVTEPFLLLRCQ